MATPKLLAVRLWNFNREWKGKDKPIQHTAHCCKLYRETEKNSIRLFYSYTTYYRMFKCRYFLSRNQTTNWLTNSMELSPWWASSSTSSQEIPCMLWNLTVHHRIHKSHPPVHIVSQINLAHAFHPNPWLSIVILPSHLSLSLPSSLFPLSFHIKLCMCLSPLHINKKRLLGTRHLTYL